MATAPQSRWLDEDLEEKGADVYVPGDGSNLPGHTVDALLVQDRVGDARDELERLLTQGVNSGPGRTMDAELFDGIVANLHVDVHS